VTRLPTYSFLPWLRHGIANTITAADGDQAIATRASTRVELQLTGDPVSGESKLVQPLPQDIALYGPGDVIGIDPRAVIRTEPHDWITNFEGNYLAAVDFYDEDFPWRYTPAAPADSHLRLRPWIALLVLAEDEFEEGRSIADRPLPYITLHDPGVLPAADDLWAWAHVHFNQSLSAQPSEIVSTDTEATLARAQSILAANPDSAYSRLLCPRRLRDDTAYHAFVIPTFETGRLAGLGQDPATAPYATASAWAPYPKRPQDLEHPVYYRWRFRTGTVGDFEYLVRLLAPQPVDPRVGSRDIDVRHPGSNLDGAARALGGILRLGGALQVPVADLDQRQLEERNEFEDWDQPYPDEFEGGLAAFVNLADDYAAQGAAANATSGLPPAIAGDTDPLITAPLYGRWHALTQRLLVERDGSPATNPTNWVHRLNLDPRFRVPAGFGADVVEANAEEYMNDVWQQIGDVLAANTRIRRMQLAVAVASRWFDRQLTPLAAVAPERALALTAPVQGRVLQARGTVASMRSASRLPPALTSTAMRRVLRPGGRLMRSLPFDATATTANLLDRINAGAVDLAPPNAIPPGVMSVEEAAAVARPAGAESSPLATLARYRWLPWALVAAGIALLAVLAIVLPLATGLILGVLLLAALAALARQLVRYRRQAAAEASIEEADQRPAEIAGFPANPAFTLTAPGSGLATPIGTEDSPVAARFKQALQDSFAMLEASAAAGRTPAPATLNLPALSGTMVSAVDPTATIPRRVFSTIELPPWIGGELLDPFGEVMAYPKIDLPMYAPLKEISVELFLPNINLIAPNSITLVETNQRFIEAYMVGLNYEFGRKLLWREYPSDLRGSYFRQFWDVRSAINSEGLSESALKEQLYDIPELHRWPPGSALGDHDNRRDAGSEAVLVVRGELLKKYPTAIVYAHRAQWELQADGVTPDLTRPRVPVRLSEAEEESPPPEKMQFPLYEAKADPDIYFFGFGLTIDQAKGGSGHPPDIDPGWFFVIKERPGEPRFGLELTRSAPPEVLDEVTWEDALGAAPAGGPAQFLAASSLEGVGLSAPPAGDPEGKQPQHEEDQRADGAAASAARWAYLLLRPPAMVAIHADQMLRSG
jgi:hypothetical protein